MFAGFLLMIMCSIIFRDARDAKIVLLGAVLSSALVLIFQTLRLFAPGALSFGVLGDATSNLIGSWNAFGIFAGLSALMSLLVVEFFPTTRIEKWLLQGLTVLSLISHRGGELFFVWSLLGVFAFIIFIYKLSLTSNDADSEGNTIFQPLFRRHPGSSCSLFLDNLSGACCQIVSVSPMLKFLHRSQPPSKWLAWRQDRPIAWYRPKQIWDSLVNV